MSNIRPLRFSEKFDKSIMYGITTHYSIKWRWLDVDERKETYGAVYNWCIAQYGKVGVTWFSRISDGEIMFVDEKDALLFLLRWA